MCAFIFRFIEQYYTKCHNGNHKSRHLFEIGKDKDIFFIPGDFDEEDDLGEL